MRILACIALGLAWSATLAPAAEEKFDPAARAKAIAPFVDEQTFAMVHLDLSRLAWEPLAAKLAELLPDEKDSIVGTKTKVAAVFDGLVRAGVKDVYAVVTLSLGPPGEFVFGVIPLRPGADVQAILDSVPISRAAHVRVGDTLLVADRKETLERVRQFKPDPRPEIAAAFDAAGDTAAQVLLIPPAFYRRVIEETMPELPKEVGGGASTILTRGALWAAAGIELPPKMGLRLVVKSQDAQAAAALSAKWNELIRLAAQWREIRGVVPDLDRAASLLAPKVEGDRLAVAFADDEVVRTLWTVGGRALIAATEGPRQAARRTQSTNNLKQIALAMHNYHDVYKCFPPHAVYSPDGKPLLSWRVLILPYVEQNQLYQQFRLNEPWDSPHNRALIEKMPSVYRSPGSKLKEKGRTNYVVSVGPQTVFHGRQGTPIKDVTDGTSNTIMVAECDDPHAPIWTKPEDMSFDPKDPLRGLGHLFTGGFNAAMCDGSVRFVTVTIPPETLRALSTKAGGEPTPDF